MDNPACVVININHIRFIKDKRKLSTFLVKPDLKFSTVLLDVSFLLTEKTF